MSTKDRMQILNMIAEGSMTAEEGAKLLEAAGKGETTLKVEQHSEIESEPVSLESSAPPQRYEGIEDLDSAYRKPSRLRVHVISKDGHSKVNVNLPLSLVDIGLRIGGRFVPELKDMDDEMATIMDALKHDVHGKIIEVEDEEEHVEIYLE